MNKISFLLLLTLKISAVGFSQTQNKKFEIKGQLSGFSDSTLIYLDDLTTSSPIHIDSTFVINNKFRFTGSLKQSVLRVLLRTKDFSNYKFFWLENSKIVFQAEKGKFRDAKIIGSKIQNEENQLNTTIQTSGKEKEVSIAFIRSHSHSIVSANILSVYASTWGRDTVSILYRTLSKKMKNTYYGKNIYEFIAHNKNIKVGDKYADFTEPNVNGKNISLSDYNGKVTLLEFWGSWCAPCRKANPELVKIYNEFKERGFEILGVAAETNKDFWMEAIKKDGLTWENVSELKGDKDKAALIYGVSYYPTNFLIDRSGIIIARDLTGDALRNKLLEVLNQ